MINPIKPYVERRTWQEFTPEALGGRLKDLKEQRENFKKLSWDMKDFISSDWMDSMISVLDSEIEYFEFYFELRKKGKTESLNEWKYEESYKVNYCDEKPCWVITNGKIKYIIKIEKGEKSTHITCIIDNDSKVLYFTPDGRLKNLSKKVLRSQESIDEYIKSSKKDAEDLFKKYELPRYCREKEDLEYLYKLLGVTNGSDE